MKDTVKNLIIFALVLIIVVGSTAAATAFSQYKHDVYDLLDSDAYSSLNMTQGQLVRLREELKQYDDAEMTPEVFQAIIHDYCRNYFFYSDYTREYQSFDKQFAYLDYSDLNSYILDLSFAELPNDEVRYHKENIMKICMYFNTLSFRKHFDYTQPEPQLKKVLEKVHKLVAEGEKRVEKYETD